MEVILASHFPSYSIHQQVLSIHIPHSSLLLPPWSKSPSCTPQPVLVTGLFAFIIASFHLFCAVLYIEIKLFSSLTLTPSVAFYYPGDEVRSPYQLAALTVSYLPLWPYLMHTSHPYTHINITQVLSCTKFSAVLWFPPSVCTKLIFSSNYMCHFKCHFLRTSPEQPK